MSRGVKGRFGTARRIAQGLGFGLAVAWSTQSCKSPSDDFECSANSDCDVVKSGSFCAAGACFYPDGRCPDGFRSRGKCTSDPNSDGSGGTSSGGTSSNGGSPSSGGSSGNSGGANGGSSSGGGPGDGGSSGTGSAPSTNPDGGPGGEGLTLVAGTIGAKGGIDGVGPLARFSTPGCLAFDGARYLYVGDEDIDTVRRVDTTTGEVTTIAGYPFAGYYEDGKGTEARFLRPECVSYDGTDAANPVLYIAEWAGNRVRKMALKDGSVTLLAGSTENEPGHVDAVGDAARFKGPEAMVRRGNFLYVTDALNNALRAINLTTREVTTVIGDVATQAPGTTDGPIATARLDIPHALALDAAGNRLFIGELHGERVRVVNLTTNEVSTLVTGTGGITSLAFEPTTKRLFASVFDGGKVLSIDVAQTPATFVHVAGSGNFGEIDGPPTTAAFRSPHGVVAASTSLVFVADYDGPTIRKLVANGSGAFQTTTLAGLKNDEGEKDGIGAEARFESPGEMALAPDNHTLYVLDGDANCSIRTFDTNTGQVATLAGGADCTSSADGTGVAALFQRPGSMAMAIPTPGRPPVLLVTEERGVVRKVDTANAKVTTLNVADDNLPTWRGIAATASHIYVAGEVEQQIFRMPVTGGALAPYAGTGAEGCDDGAVASATLGRPASILWDGATTLFFADQDCQMIRRINLTNNTVQTVAGGDADKDENPDGVGKGAAFGYPAGLMWDRQKKGFYVQDVHVVRWVDAKTFEVKTLVGDKDSHGGVWLPPNPPRLNFPGGLIEGLDGELYITSERAILKWVAP